MVGGTQRGTRKHKQNKNSRAGHVNNKMHGGMKKQHDTIHENLKPENRDKFKPGGENLPKDEDRAGEGQFYCISCDKYFMNPEHRKQHYKSKSHKRMVKEMLTKPHTQKDADDLGKH